MQVIHLSCPVVALDAMTSWDDPTTLALRAASSLEPDPDRLMRWFNEDVLEGFGDLTARTLCEAGYCEGVLAFLDAVSRWEGESLHVEMELWSQKRQRHRRSMRVPHRGSRVSLFVRRD